MRRISTIIEGMRRGLRSRAVLALAGLILAGGVTVAAMALLRGPKPPPSIFDTPADNVARYLTSGDFSALPVEQRLQFISELIERFRSMSQTDSAVVAAFFAGMTGPAKEILRTNIRTLGKDILVEGAAGYLAIKPGPEREAYLDQWLVKWARFGQQLGMRGSKPDQTDGEILSRMQHDARRDAERGINFNPRMAQSVVDFWQSDIASVTTPTEQGQVFKFLPAIRDHLLKQQP